ncbi:alpha-1D adrenergic receptor-like isoform X3 [Macrobrachium nipponense]|uniref:alpha-1D adrenergic receptor-like isoform X3 n=1 Tax=Macrobrachium nipponense TaxID=159736 RepID=UPI0030C7C276
MMNATGTHSSGLLASSPSSASSAVADIRNSSGGAMGEEDDIVASLNLPYTVCEVLVAVMAVIGNALTIVVFVKERRLRRLTNYYIVSLALADLLVGMPGIPFAILTSVGIPHNSYMCPPMLSLLLMLCTVSIFCLVAVSVDRYWAILYPLRYSRVMTAKIARRIILLCWLAGIFLGFLPLMGWRQEHEGGCYFVKVMDYNYLVFIYFSTIVFPGILMAFFYTHIYTVVLKQTKLSVKSEHGTLRQIAAQEPQSEAGSVCTQHGGSQRQRPHFLVSRNQSRSQSEVNRCDSRRCSTSTNVVHQVTHANKREVKAAKSLSIIVLFFLICWFPLYTINFAQSFCPRCTLVTPEAMYFTIILTHVNSAVNPFLYAYHMKDFRHALKTFILEKILRRKAQSEPLSHRSLVSPHHSTLYRVAVGGGSPQLANFHTPHTHNTPIQSSSSPVAGTPSGNRSRSSTLGSYGHWLQSKGVSSTVSLGKTPEDKDEPLCRPRAATITSHTSPASVHSAEEACLKKPLLSASNLLTLTHESCGGGEITEHQTVSSSSDAVTINFSATDPTEVVIGFDQYSDGLSAITDDSFDQQVRVIPTLQLNDSKLPPGNTTPLSDAYQNSTTPLTAESSLEFVRKIADSTELSSASGGDELAFYSRNITSEATYNRPMGRNANCESECPLGSAKCLSDHDMCDLERSITDDGKRLSESTLSQNCLTRENKPNGTDHSINSSGGKRLAASEINVSQIPNGTEDNITSSSTGKYESTNNCDVLSKRKESEIMRLEETPKQPRKHEATTDESSPLSQEFYRYLPKMLRKKDENKKSKSARTGKGWLSSMMRNRSYHGLSVEVAGSKQLPRAKSISGAMDT